MKLESIIEKINQQRNEIEKHGRIDPEVLKKINYKFRLDWNYYSNRMEGGTLTQSETRSVMVGNIDVKGKPFKDIMEMNGHDRTVLDILKLGKGEQRLSEKRIKKIHRTIMHEDDTEKRKEIGEWKTTANEIINYKGEKIDFTTPTEVPDKVHEVLNNTNAELDAFFNPKKQSKHPLEIASQFHIDFVSIHPFYDGNGRTTRILMNIILVSCGYPPIIIKDDQKKSYYQLLADIQVYGGKSDLLQAFIGERLIESQQLVIDAIDGKSIEEEDDFEKEINILKRKQTLPAIKVQKSNELMKDILETVYIPLLKVVNEKIIKISELFEEQNWIYYEETSDIPKKSNLNSISNYFIKVNNKVGNSAHNFKATSQFKNYKDVKKFSMEVAFRIYFHKHNYVIEVFIGSINHSLKNFQKLNEVVKAITKEDVYSKDSLKFDLIDKEYGESVSNDEISNWSKLIANKTISILKEKVK